MRGKNFNKIRLNYSSICKELFLAATKKPKQIFNNKLLTD
jgi:hypothetical protein